MMPELLSALRRRLLEAIDLSVPLDLRSGDPEQARRARILVGFSMVLIVLGVETLLFFRFAISGLEPGRIDYGLLVANLLVWAAFVTLRRRQAITLASNLVLGGALLVIVAALTVIGGIAAPLLHWIALVPVLALLLGGRRSALAWLVVCTVIFAGLISADALGIDLGSPVALHGLKASGLWVQKTIDVGSWVVMFFAVALIYEHMREAQTAVVDAKNRQLEDEIIQRARAEERTQYLAYFDELTALPNRTSFKQNLARAMAFADRNASQLAVMLLDLDGFKAVNDNYGHGLGDELLIEVARRLESCVRQSDQVARSIPEEAVSRLGGDEFTILIDRLEERRMAAIVAARVLDSLSDPIRIGAHEIFISGSIGIALYPGPVETLDELLRCADMAMYHAKARGKNAFRFFEESMNQEIRRRTRIATELRHAFENKEFTLHYQPIVAAGSGAVIGAEALLRWDHPARGLLCPSDFIDVAEESRLIVALGDWVVHEACQQMARWAAQGARLGRLAINVSALQLRGDGLPALLGKVLRQHGLRPEQLDLEITENAMMIEEAEAIRCLGALKAMGARITLDDFGTGYSSLSYVKRFPVDALKIDRSFTQELEFDDDAHGIAAAIVAMGQRLHLTVVGEGVEQESQAGILRNFGCDELQGNLFSPPVPADRLPRLLAGKG